MRVRSLLAAVVWLLCAAHAKAQTQAIHFVWQRPVGSMCPSRAVLEADVEQAMGHSVFTARADAGVIVRGAIDDRLDGVRVRLDAVSPRGDALGTRELSAPAGECASLRDAIGLVLTLFAEYGEASQTATDTAFGFGAAAELASTPLPRMALSLGPGLLLEHGRVLQLRASAAYWLPVSIQTADGVGAKLEAVSLALRACARVWGGFGLCAGVESGALIATPLQLQGPARQVRLLAHGVLDARWDVQLGVVRAGIAVGPLLSLSRPEISYLKADGVRMAVYRPQLGGIILQLAVIILGE